MQNFLFSTHASKAVTKVNFSESFSKFGREKTKLMKEIWAQCARNSDLGQSGSRNYRPPTTNLVGACKAAGQRCNRAECARCTGKNALRVRSRAFAWPPGQSQAHRPTGSHVLACPQTPTRGGTRANAALLTAAPACRKLPTQQFCPRVQQVSCVGWEA